MIDKWLTDDKKAPRKQRHTAKRVFRRLEKEVPGFNCSYRLVADYVATKKKELHCDKKDGFLPLVHMPGEAQADFGTAAFYENGRYYEHGKLHLAGSIGRICEANRPRCEASVHP